jgi:putative lipoic acid-binding regulatory protein
MYLIKIKEVSDQLKTIVEDLNSDGKFDKNRVVKMVGEEQEQLEKLYQDIIKKQK